MSGLKQRFAVAMLLASMPIGWAQTLQSLQKRIPKPHRNKYHAVREGTDWKNPYLIVRPDGIEITGVTAAGQAIPLKSVPAVLNGLPDPAWPYGLVVAVQEVGLLAEGDRPRIQANRKTLLTLLKKLAIIVDPWPSA